MIFAADPLFGGDLLPVIGVTVLKVLIAFTLLLVSVMLMVWFERKIVSDMQNRIGPSIAGPWGLFQTLADGIKLFFKEDLVKYLKICDSATSSNNVQLITCSPMKASDMIRFEKSHFFEEVLDNLIWWSFNVFIKIINRVVQT